MTRKRWSSGASSRSVTCRETSLVVGDGPVEIRAARAAGAVALGLAADEAQRGGLDERKRRRLLEAGADMLVTDFAHAQELADILCKNQRDNLIN